jgi:hypothetical protein
VAARPNLSGRGLQEGVEVEMVDGIEAGNEVEESGTNRGSYAAIG